MFTKNRKEYDKQYRKEHRQEIKEYSIRYRNEHKRESTAYYKERKISSREKLLLNSARRRAKNKNISFTITEKDIKIPKLCPVLEIPIVLDSSGHIAGAPSIDRIDNNRGYEPGNILVVSRRANILKNDSTIDELSKIVEFYRNLK